MTSDKIQFCCRNVQRLAACAIDVPFAFNGFTHSRRGTSRVCPSRSRLALLTFYGCGHKSPHTLWLKTARAPGSPGTSPSLAPRGSKQAAARSSRSPGEHVSSLPRLPRLLRSSARGPQGSLKPAHSGRVLPTASAIAESLPLSRSRTPEFHWAHQGDVQTRPQVRDQDTDVFGGHYSACPLKLTTKEPHTQGGFAHRRALHKHTPWKHFRPKWPGQDEAGDQPGPSQARWPAVPQPRTTLLLLSRCCLIIASDSALGDIRTFEMSRVQCFKILRNMQV